MQKTSKGGSCKGKKIASGGKIIFHSSRQDCAHKRLNGLNGLIHPLSCTVLLITLLYSPTPRNQHGQSKKNGLVESSARKSESNDKSSDF